MPWKIHISPDARLAPSKQKLSFSSELSCKRADNLPGGQESPCTLKQRQTVSNSGADALHP